MPEAEFQEPACDIRLVLVTPSVCTLTIPWRFNCRLMGYVPCGKFCLSCGCSQGWEPAPLGGSVLGSPCSLAHPREPQGICGKCGSLDASQAQEGQAWEGRDGLGHLHEWETYSSDWDFLTFSRTLSRGGEQSGLEVVGRKEGEADLSPR